MYAKISRWLHEPCSAPAGWLWAWVPNHARRKLRLSDRSSSTPPVIASTEAAVSTSACAAELATEAREERDRRRGEIEAEQARERGAERDADSADDPRRLREPPPARGAGIEVREPDAEGHRPEGGQVVRAEERPLALTVDQEALDRPDVCRRVHREQRDDERPDAIAAVEHVDRAQRERAELDQLPAGDERRSRRSSRR